jgi:hypothetical protein
VNNVVITAHSQLSVDPADREAANNCHCPKLSQLLDDRAQEEYRGVALHHFSDQKALSLVKSYIALLPVPIAGYLKHIIFVEAADRLSGAQGLTTSPDTFYLKTGFEPDTFFHESTHISDMHNNWMQSKKWAQAFMGNDRLAKNTSILGTFDGSNAQEQIADFTGRVYGFYLKNRPSGSFTAAFGQDGRAKLDFLLNNGLVTGAVYDSLTRR